MEKDVIAKLEQPLPIKQTSGRNKFNYIDGDDVRKRLNEAFDYDWSEELIESSFDEHGAIVKLYLVVNCKNSPTGVIKKIGFGQSDTSGNAALGIGDALKTAHTNAVKDAAKGFGIGVGMSGVAASLPPQIDKYVKYNKDNKTPTTVKETSSISYEEEIKNRYEEPPELKVVGSPYVAPKEVTDTGNQEQIDAALKSFIQPLSVPTTPAAAPQVSVSRGTVKEITGMQLGALRNIAKKEKKSELDIIKALFPDFNGEDFSNLTLPDASNLIKHWRSLDS